MKRKEFEEKVFSLKDKIFRFACSILSNTADAEDVVQDIFTKLWKDKNKLSRIENLESYVMSSTKNICIDRIKHKKVKFNKIDDLRSRYPQSYNDETSENVETRMMIRKIIDLLPEKQRMIIHLRDVEGYEFEEMEEMLDMNLNALRTNLSRARNKVKDEMIKIMSYGMAK